MDMVISRPLGIELGLQVTHDGFMGGPGGGRALAEYIITGDVPSEIRPFNAQRFKTGELVIEPAIIKKEH